MDHILVKELKEARRSCGLSQAMLAARINVEPQVIKRLEAGIGSVTTLVAVKAALDFQLNGIGPGHTLGDQLQGRRLRKGVSLEALARRAKLSRATIASLEQGNGSVRSLLRLLAVITPNARRRAKERAFWGAGDKFDRDSRFTPPDFMEHIYTAFGEIDLDPCAHLLSPVIARRRIILSEGGDGLVDDWSGRLAFMNPPFSALLIWLKRAFAQWQAGNVETVVCLVPVRSDSAWFHETLSPVADIYLLQGRVRFLDSQGKGQPTPFSLMLLTLGASTKQRMRFASLVPGFWMTRAPDMAGPSMTT